MPGIARDILSGEEEATLKRSDAPAPTKNFSKILRPSLQSMDTETLDLDLAKEYPYLVTADMMLLSESGSDNERQHFAPAREYRPEEEIRIRDFAFPGPAMDQTDQKAMQPSSFAGEPPTSNATATPATRHAEPKNAIDRSLWVTSPSSPASLSRAASPQTARPFPLTALSSPATAHIVLDSAPPLDRRTMDIVPPSRKTSTTPSPPPNKPLPPIPEAQSSHPPQLSPSTLPPTTPKETPLSISSHEPPIPPKSPRRSQRPTLRITNDEDLQALASLHPKANHDIPTPSPSSDSGFSSPSPSQTRDAGARTHDELLQWRQRRTAKTQARKKRDLEQRRTGTGGVHGYRAEGADDTDDTIVLPVVVTGSGRASAVARDKTPLSFLERWDALAAGADGGSPVTVMVPPVVPPPLSFPSFDTRSFSPPHRGQMPIKTIQGGEATPQRSNTPAPVVLHPAPLRRRRNVSVRSPTRPLYAHSTQGTLYIPPSPPLSPTAPPPPKEKEEENDDPTTSKLSTRASFARHRSSASYATIIVPNAEHDPDDFSLCPGSETEAQLQAELAAERKRSALLKAALVAMIDASVRLESPPASEAGKRLSALSGRSGGSGSLEATLEATLEAMLERVAGGDV